MLQFILYDDYTNARHECSKNTFSHVPATFSDLLTMPLTSFPGCPQIVTLASRPWPSDT